MWQVEIDDFCRKVLAKHWPEVPRYGDIRTLDLERVERVELVCGGFPCQPVSVAGKRLAQADARWLWPEFSRVIRALRPRLVLVENVPGLLVRGFGDVVGDLAASGYDTEWDCIPASAVGAPHQRDRVWLVAYAAGGARGEVGTDVSGASDRDLARQESGRGARGSGGRGGTTDALADTNRRGREELGLAEPRGLEGAPGREPDGRGEVREQRDTALADAASARLEIGRDRERLRQFAASVGSGQWSLEPAVGRVADGLPRGLVGWRIAALAALGNAVVPQIAEFIGRRLMETR